MISLSKEQIVSLHEQQLARTGGISGIRDEALLDSALSMPYQTFDGVDLFPSTIAKIARVTYGLVCILERAI